ncbi:MAG: aspartate carbamoyltransferase [Candidatus Coatesbacteria bacterium]|nr:MAG: aspartate carbamoyltransferase [Candidatus Coatesbacteria bacterium]RLC42759.1 MAG: aspartate carbamoyltransferase [Candidatus Coatesbacteria bacterium]
MDKNFIEIEGLKREVIEGLLNAGLKMLEVMEVGCDLAKGKILATAFYEPSTRTRLSFTSAMMRLGGKVFNLGDLAATSATKGEVLMDTVRMLSSYSDIIAMRHPNEGTQRAMSLYSDVPIINGGDGGHEHPTQTMLDLLTILIEKGTIDGITVCAVGDLYYGRTVHSLAYALSNFDTKMICISPDGLYLPEYVQKKLPDGFVERVEEVEEAVKKADVLYVTRLQRERFDDPGLYESVKNRYIITKYTLSKARDDLIILHPLPRVFEISYEVDKDPRAVYFKQAFYGVPMRMAIIGALLGLIDAPIPPHKPSRPSEVPCQNKRCITDIETYLPQLKDENGMCYYCTKPMKVQEELYQ